MTGKPKTKEIIRSQYGRIEDSSETIIKYQNYNKEGTLILILETISNLNAGWSVVTYLF